MHCKLNELALQIAMYTLLFQLELKADLVSASNGDFR
jgi:hypothetical protein